VEVCGPAGVWRSGGGCASLRAASAAHQEFTRVRLDGQHTQSAPSPLWGRAGEGGREFWQNCCLISRPPPPIPPHKGEGRRRRALLVLCIPT
jgi:hypothetical protein